MFCCTTMTARAARSKNAGADSRYQVAGDGDGRVDIGAVLDELGRRAINEVLVEAGPASQARFWLTAGYVDELVIYQAPHIMGSETRQCSVNAGWQSLADRVTLDIVDVRKVGGRHTALPRESNKHVYRNHQSQRTRSTHIEQRGGDVRLRVVRRLAVGRYEIGESISVNGVCLTAVELFDDGFERTYPWKRWMSQTLGSSRGRRSIWNRL